MTVQPVKAVATFAAGAPGLDSEGFFRLREWACALGTSFVAVARRMELEQARPVSFWDGVYAATHDDTRAFLVRHEDGIFVFSEGIGFSDISDRLSQPGSAYSIRIDARAQFLCCRSVGGRCVREVSSHTELSMLDRETILSLASAWGPDPRALLRAAPRGMLYDTRTRRRREYAAGS